MGDNFFSVSPEMVTYNMKGMSVVITLYLIVCSSNRGAPGNDPR